MILATLLNDVKRVATSLDTPSVLMNFRNVFPGVLSLGHAYSIYYGTQ